ncbi:MAG: RNA-binding transcriptional accessory protein [Firmicutes bacterium]|nr:RNA-binding transcriptional accessory protein [Bacillota bacterium]
MTIIKQLAQELKIRPAQAEQTVGLLDAGNTIPFIARYRKEATGELDETVIRSLAERLAYLRKLEERRREIRRLLTAQKNLNPEISQAISQAGTQQELEDLYRPFRPKRRTRASRAREKGLEPLALKLLEQGGERPSVLSGAFLSGQVTSKEEALQGAEDILAEKFSDDPELRALIRKFSLKTGLLVSSKGGPEKIPGEENFAMYFDYLEDLSKIPPHRILALNRGERLKVLRINIKLDLEQIYRLLEGRILTNPNSPAAAHIRAAIKDGYRRLMGPSLEREIRNSLTEKSEKHAIQIFAENLRNLLLQSPIRGRKILGIDPAYRTGCKVAVLDEFGEVLEHTAIFPHKPQKRWDLALRTLEVLVEKHKVTLLTIGNGTASRETEQLAAELIKKRGGDLRYLVVSEAGASVYSASDLAKKEFPNLDVSIRGAISIARRVQDPLAELVKIDPKSIGVGQYQHDVNQKELAATLGSVVESCVNHAGVELNTASAPLLRCVSGLSERLAQEIVDRRALQGPFKKRTQLQEIKGLGPKTFQQAAGFLRIGGGAEPLDNTGVHPESYPLAEQILERIGFTAADLQDPETLKRIQKRLTAQDPKALSRELEAGEPTIRDILASLSQPGRDPRDELPAPLFREDVLKIADLKPGMVLQGTVQNVVDFGAFVDLGVQKAGLVHVSELSEHYVRHPTDLVQVGDAVTVRVLSVNPEQERISLTMKNPAQTEH